MERGYSEHTDRKRNRMKSERYHKKLWHRRRLGVPYVPGKRIFRKL
jgi:hypothetical protein